jgi:hypothetical protein
MQHPTFQYLMNLWLWDPVYQYHEEDEEEDDEEWEEEE